MHLIYIITLSLLHYFIYILHVFYIYNYCIIILHCYKRYNVTYIHIYIICIYYIHMYNVISIYYISSQKLIRKLKVIFSHFNHPHPMVTTHHSASIRSVALNLTCK